MGSILFRGVASAVVRRSEFMIVRPDSMDACECVRELFGGEDCVQLGRLPSALELPHVTCTYPRCG